MMLHDEMVMITGLDHTAWWKRRWRCNWKSTSFRMWRPKEFCQEGARRLCSLCRMYGNTIFLRVLRKPWPYIYPHITPPHILAQLQTKDCGEVHRWDTGESLRRVWEYVKALKVFKVFNRIKYIQKYTYIGFLHLCMF